MPFVVSCFCSVVWAGQPPDTCPKCGAPILPSTEAPMPPLRFDPVEAIGWTTTDDARETGTPW